MSHSHTPMHSSKLPSFHLPLLTSTTFIDSPSDCRPLFFRTPPVYISISSFHSLLLQQSHASLGSHTAYTHSCHSSSPVHVIRTLAHLTTAHELGYPILLPLASANTSHIDSTSRFAYPFSEEFHSGTQSRSRHVFASLISR